MTLENISLNSEKECLRQSERCNVVKVNKFRKQNVLFSFEPKTERNYFLISALRI